METIKFLIYALWCALQPGPLDEADGAERDSKQSTALEATL
jgi:hypothetical protein